MTVGDLVVVTLACGVLCGMLCWPYVINAWLVFSGKEATMVWWEGGLLGLVPVFGWVSLPAAVFTWLMMLFLGYP